MVAKPRATKESWQRSAEHFEVESEHWKKLYQAERDRVNRLRAALQSSDDNLSYEARWAKRTREDIEEDSIDLLHGDMTDNSSSETRHLTIPADEDWARRR